MDLNLVFGDLIAKREIQWQEIISGIELRCSTMTDSDAGTSFLENSGIDCSDYSEENDDYSSYTSSTRGDSFAGKEETNLISEPMDVYSQKIPAFIETNQPELNKKPVTSTVREMFVPAIQGAEYDGLKKLSSNQENPGVTAHSSTIHVKDTQTQSLQETSKCVINDTCEDTLKCSNANPDCYEIFEKCSFITSSPKQVNPKRKKENSEEFFSVQNELDHVLHNKPETRCDETFESAYGSLSADVKADTTLAKAMNSLPIQKTTKCDESTHLRSCNEVNLNLKNLKVVVEKLNTDSILRKFSNIILSQRDFCLIKNCQKTSSCCSQNSQVGAKRCSHSCKTSLSSFSVCDRDVAVVGQTLEKHKNFDSLCGEKKVKDVLVQKGRHLQGNKPLRKRVNCLFTVEEFRELQSNLKMSTEYKYVDSIFCSNVLPRNKPDIQKKTINKPLVQHQKSPLNVCPLADTSKSVRESVTESDNDQRVVMAIKQEELNHYSYSKELLLANKVVEPEELDEINSEHLEELIESRRIQASIRKVEAWLMSPENEVFDKNCNEGEFYNKKAISESDKSFEMSKSGFISGNAISRGKETEPERSSLQINNFCDHSSNSTAVSPLIDRCFRKNNVLKAKRQSSFPEPSGSAGFRKPYFRQKKKQT